MFFLYANQKITHLRWFWGLVRKPVWWMALLLWSLALSWAFRTQLVVGLVVWKIGWWIQRSVWAGFFPPWNEHTNSQSPWKWRPCQKEVSSFNYWFLGSVYIYIYFLMIKEKKSPKIHSLDVWKNCEKFPEANWRFFRSFKDFQSSQKWWVHTADLNIQEVKL